MGSPYDFRPRWIPLGLVVEITGPEISGSDLSFRVIPTRDSRIRLETGRFSTGKFLRDHGGHTRVGMGSTNLGERK